MKHILLLLFTLVLCYSCDEDTQKTKSPDSEKKTQQTVIKNNFVEKNTEKKVKENKTFKQETLGHAPPTNDTLEEETEDKEPDNMNGIVATHNLYRADVGVPPLRWSNKLAKSARDWALELKNQTQTRERFVFKHSPHDWRKDKGENLSWYSQLSKGYKYAWNLPFLKSPSDAVKDWGDERKDYDYKTNSCRPGEKCGHYTQVVWEKTKKVGCAKLNHKDINYNNWYRQQELWVCHYEPAGNYIGVKPY